MNNLFTQLCEKRHLSDSYIHPRYDALEAPAKMPDMKKAVSRLKDAIKNQEKVLIYGDYDVDGITASTVMEDTLALAGLPRDHISIMLPDRFVDGYGMSARLVERAIAEKIPLVVTVDCGSRNHDIVRDLRAAHIDVIITDHHECEPTLPEAIAIVNPKRQDFTGPASLRDLAGVGVAFKLAQALVAENLIPAGQEKWLLDLVLLGTICDSMPLTIENRILTYYGIKVLAKTRRPGLRALMQTSGAKLCNSESINFKLGPRLNAAGRLTTAETALNLLRTHLGIDAVRLATELEKLNQTRRDAQSAALHEIRERGVAPGSVIVETGQWHEGILGIIAGRLVDVYHKPAFVLAEVEKDIFKGSGRSFGEFNLAEALAQAGDAIIGGGGHAGAAGVRVESAHLDDFRQSLNDYYTSLHLTDQERFLRSSPDLEFTNLGDLTIDALEELQTLEPFGPGNHEPLFCLKSADIMETRHMGKDGTHLRLDLRGADGHIVKAIAFGAPAPWFSLDPASQHSFLLRPIINEWQGTRSVEAMLVDVLPT